MRLRSVTFCGLWLAAALAGCHQPPPVSPTPRDVPYLTDAAGDAPPRYDILSANYTELSGSLVVRIDIQNYADGLPLFLVRFNATPTSLPDSQEFFARVVPDPSRPTSPQVSAEAGRVRRDPEGIRFEEVHATCWTRSQPSSATGTDWRLYIELLHNRTGLSAGGTLQDLYVETRDLAGTEQDQAERRQVLPVAGGPNPYLGRSPECPLQHERANLEP